MVMGLILLFIVVVLVIRRRAKRALVAGLDSPATWREPAAGRVGRNRSEVL